MATLRGDISFRYLKQFFIVKNNICFIFFVYIKYL